MFLFYLISAFEKCVRLISIETRNQGAILIYVSNLSCILCNISCVRLGTFWLLTYFVANLKLWRIVDNEVSVFAPVLYRLKNAIESMFYYSKTCLRRPLKNRKKYLKDKWWLNEGRKYCRMLSWSILQYFWPALTDNRFENQILAFALSGRLK